MTRTRARSVRSKPVQAPKGRGFLCLASHPIPSQPLLENVAASAIGEYMPQWTTRTRYVGAQAPVGVIVSGGKIWLQPLPIDVIDDAPFGLCYANEFDETTQNAECRVQGFVIFTSPQASVQRAERFIVSNMLIEGLLHYDKAIAGYAEIKPEAVTDQIEARYRRYAKFRNLAIDNASGAEHESALALTLALREAKRCWKEMIG